VADCPVSAAWPNTERLKGTVWPRRNHGGHAVLLADDPLFRRSGEGVFVTNAMMLGRKVKGAEL
jgi:hypothetical protein